MSNKIIWSDEQEAYFDFMQNGQGNLVVSARAGTGKTTTAKVGFEYAPEKRMLYAVFNKKNQREAEAKITDSRVDVLTLHSLGFRFVKRVWPNARPDNDVEYDRANNVLLAAGVANNKALTASLVKLVGFLKNTTISPTQQQAYDVAQKQDLLGVNPREDEIIVCGALRVLEKSKERDARGRISFDDMVWLPVAMSLAKPTYDMVVIDEAQDMNMPQLMMARQASKGRVVVIGDDRQAIYGFRGAVQGAMAMMKATLKAAQIGLTVTRRCPHAVVRLANEIVPDYKAAPEAPEGKVEGLGLDKLADVVKVGDAILSRLNAPLMPTALKLLRKNVPARIEGRDIGAQLITMVRTLRASDIESFLANLEAWQKKQHVRLQGRKNAEKLIEQTDDIVETLQALSEGCDTPHDLETRLRDLFQDTDEDSKPAVILSSVHKAKGLEWHRVFMLTETFRKGKGTEEDNIWYVAVTRAQSELYLVGTGALPLTKQEMKTLEKQGLPAPVVPEPPKSKGGTRVPKTTETKTPQQEVDDARAKVESEMVRMEVGNIVMMCDKEHVVTVVEEDSAIIRFSPNADGRIRLLGNKTHPTRILRTIPEEQIDEFLSGWYRRCYPAETNNETQSGGNGTTSMKTKSSGSGESIMGRSAYIESLLVANPKISDKEIFEKVSKKYEGSTEKGVGEQIRARKERLKRAASGGTKTAKAKTPAKGKATPPPRKGAKPAAKPPTRPAKASAAPAKGKTAPPPRQPRPRVPLPPPRLPPRNRKPQRNRTTPRHDK